MQTTNKIDPQPQPVENGFEIIRQVLTGIIKMLVRIGCDSYSMHIDGYDIAITKKS